MSFNHDFSGMMFMIPWPMKAHARPKKQRDPLKSWGRDSRDQIFREGGDTRGGLGQMMTFIGMIHIAVSMFIQWFVLVSYWNMAHDENHVFSWNLVIKIREWFNRAVTGNP